MWRSHNRSRVGTHGSNNPRRKGYDVVVADKSDIALTRWDTRVIVNNIHGEVHAKLPDATERSVGGIITILATGDHPIHVQAHDMMTVINDMSSTGDHPATLSMSSNVRHTLITCISSGPKSVVANVPTSPIESVISRSRGVPRQSFKLSRRKS